MRRRFVCRHNKTKKRDTAMRCLERQVRTSPTMCEMSKCVKAKRRWGGVKRLEWLRECAEYFKCAKASDMGNSTRRMMPSMAKCAARRCLSARGQEVKSVQTNQGHSKAAIARQVGAAVAADSISQLTRLLRFTWARAKLQLARVKCLKHAVKRNVYVLFGRSGSNIMGRRRRQD